MDRKTLSALLLLLAAAIFSPRPNAVSPAGASATENTPSSRVPRILTSTGDGPWKPICDHLRTEESPRNLAACLALPGAKDVKFRSIIATLPDPEQTHLSLYFDRFIESIVWAVTDEDYSLESYWFPWRPKANKEAGADKETESKEDREKRLNNPGLLLFRNGSSQLLAVFVVGERPTFGINRVAFRTAVEAIDVLPKAQPADGTAYILGPSFSGSLAPLRSLIQSSSGWALQNPKKPFFIVTGGATNRNALDGHTGDARVCSTIENDTVSLCAFSRYLARWPQSPGREVALVTEDETAYGKVDPGHNSGDPASTAKCFLNDGDNDSDDDVHFLQLRYPRGISRLRNSSEELPGLTPAQNAPSGYQELPLILKEPGDDTIPSFSSQQTPVSAESVLQNLAVTLRRKHIRYAGIVATDPLDQLFLSRFLKTACPDIQLFILGSDLLFVRAARQWGLEGILSITNYPLFLQNQDYMADQHPPRRVAFSSGYAEGVYNAARRILLAWRPDGKDASDSCRAANQQGNPPRDLMLEYSPPFHDATSSGKPVRSRRPALWLTVVGRDSFWPVSLLPLPEDLRSTLKTSLLEGPALYNPGEEFRVERRSTFWNVVCIALFLFSTLISGAVLWMNIHPDNPLRRLSGMRNFSFRHGNVFATEKAAHLLVIVVNALLVNLLFLAPALLVDRDLEAWVSISFALLFFGEAIWMTFVILKQRSAGVLWLAGLSWGFFALSLYFLISLIWPDDGFHAGYFFAYRSIHPEGGVSPTAPLLLFAIAYYYWAWLQLRRYRLAEELGSGVPKILSTASIRQRARHFVRASDGFLNEIGGVFGKRTFLISAPLIAVWLLLFNPGYWTRTFEPRSYDRLVMICLAVMYVMLIGNSVRFMLLWSELHTLLRSLERHPLRDTFSRLPHDLCWTAIWSGNVEPVYRSLSRSRDCLRRFASSRFMDRVDRALDTIQRDSRCGRDYTQALHKLQSAYGAAAYWLWRRILRAAWLEARAESVEQRNASAAVQPLTENDERCWFASEFVALQYMTFIRYVLLQMRNFLEFVTLGFVLTFLAMIVYPFEAHRAISTANVVLFVVLAIGVAVVFAQMSRSPLLSRLAGTTPERLDWGFVWRVVSFGALPLLTLLGSEFPAIGNFLFSWVQPAVQAIK